MNLSTIYTNELGRRLVHLSDELRHDIINEVPGLFDDDIQETNEQELSSASKKLLGKIMRQQDRKRFWQNFKTSFKLALSLPR